MGSRLKSFSQTISKFRKISLGTSCFIYHVEENQKYIELTKIIFEEFLSTGKTEAIGSTLIITEILTKPYRQNRQDLVRYYKDLILALPNFSIFSPQEQICDTAAYIRAKYTLRTPDAIHLATALEHDAKAILTNDSKWKKVHEIKALILEDFV